MINVHGLTHMGRVRKGNEDALASDEGLGLFVVADGMGGHNAGEVASQLVIDTLRAFLVRSATGEDCTWPFGLDPKLTFNGNRLVTGLRLANRRVFKASEARDEYTGMGSTGAVVLVDKDEITFASVGDTRIYLSHAGELIQLTQDDTWGSRIRLLDPATLPAAVREGPMDHVLTKVLGASEEIDIEVFQRRLEPADRVVLCSDGLYNSIEAQKLASIIGGPLEVVPTVEALVRTALEDGGRDNITALLIEYCTASA